MMIGIARFHPGGRLSIPNLSASLKSHVHYSHRSLSSRTSADRNSRRKGSSALSYHACPWNLRKKRPVPYCCHLKMQKTSEPRIDGPLSVNHAIGMSSVDSRREDLSGRQHSTLASSTRSWTLNPDAHQGGCHQDCKAADTMLWESFGRN